MSRHTISAWLRFGLGLTVGCAIALNAWAGDSAITVGDGYTIVTGPAGATLIFPIQRSGDLSHDAYISYKTRDGSAAAGYDYTAAHGYFKIPAGAGNADLRVPVAGSSVNSPDKTFALDVTGASAMPPALGFGPAQDFATGGQGPYPGELMAVDMNRDGLPDLIAIDYANSTVSVALSTTMANAATASFGAPQSFSTGPSPTTVTAADLNGDGAPDLIVTDSADGTVSVLINTTNPGDSAASFVPEVSTATGAQPSSVAVADVNGDGKPDVIVGHDGEAFVSVLLNATSNGAFAPAFSAQDRFMVGPDIEAVAAADLNGDGKPDLVASVAGTGLAVLINQTATGAPAATFASSQFIGGTASRSIAAADMNGDGVADLVDLNPAGSVEVQLNTTATGAATASFSALQTFAASGSPSALAVADVDGDGMADLLVGDTTNGQVSLLINGTTPGSGSASFAVARTFAIAGVGSLTTADLNGDTQPDILGAQQANGGSVAVLMNTTVLMDQAQFTPIQAIGGTASPSIVAADLDGDGEADLIGVNSSYNGVEVQMNTTPAGATTASFGPLQAFIVGNDPTTLAVADMNGDGMPDLVVGNLADSTVSVLLNQTPPGGGPAAFMPQQAFYIQGVDSLAIADVNSDGKPDILGAQQGGNLYGSVLLNQTEGAATPLAFAMPQMFDTGGQGPGTGGLATADLNRDYIPDVITTDYYGNTVSVALNTTPVGAPNASYAVPQTFTTGPNPGQVIAADLNDDFSLDLIVANGDGTVSVLMNTFMSDGFTMDFAPQVAFATGGSGPSYVTVADVNGDGKPDLVVANSAATSLSVLLNQTPAGVTTPVFAAPQPFTVGAGAQSVTTGDLNGDGKPDLVVNLAGSGFGALINTHDNISGTPASATGTIHYEIATPEALIQPSNKDFGNVGLGQSSGLYPMDLFNDGTADLTGIAVSVTGTDAGDFTVTNDCPTSLAPNMHCTIYVAFSPGALGTRTANLSVTSNDAGSPDTAALTGTGVGPAATANPGSVTTTVNQAVSGTFSATPGYTGQTLTFYVVPNPGHGTVTVTNASTGAFTYTPNTGYVGTDSFYFYAVDGNGSSSNTALETVTINDVAATANNGNISTSADTAVNGTLSATAGYGGQSLSYSVVANPIHGTLSVTAATGAFTYTPANGFAGSDSFTFKVTDGAGTASNVATESINVSDRAGQADDGAVITTPDAAVSGTLLSSSTYAGQTLSYGIVTQPAHGSVTLDDAATGAFTYTPATGYAGADSFTFKVTDAFGTASNAATESVTVNDQAPTASGGNILTSPDLAVNGTLQATTAYAGQTLGYSVTQPGHGTVSFDAATGSFTYTPTQGYAGADSFSYTVTDQWGTSANASYSVSVDDVPPTVSGTTSFSMTHNTSHSGSFSSTPKYTGQVLTFAAVTNPGHGTLTLDAGTGAYTYRPTNGYKGSDSFSVHVTDQWGTASNTLTVSITIR